MLDGMDMWLRFLVAFLVVFVLIGVTFYLVRRFGSDRLGSASARGRQPRLAVIDATAVDSRRRLILIRRDNVEHLVMIGGPTDVVVEANIVRAGATARDGAAPRSPADTLPPRAAPLPEGNMWPLQPEPAPVPRPQRPPPVEEPMQWHAEPELPPPPPRRPEPRQADPLAGLAAELSRQQTQPDPAPPRARPAPRERDAARPRAPQPEPMRAAAPPAEESFAPNADQSLAEMAHRLEAALRRPKPAEPRGPEIPQRPAAMTSPAMPAMAVEPIPAASAEPMTMREDDAMPPVLPNPAARAASTPVAPTAKPAAPKSVYDSLEQEMASLLGRPNTKT